MCYCRHPGMYTGQSSSPSTVVVVLSSSAEPQLLLDYRKTPLKRFGPVTSPTTSLQPQVLTQNAKYSSNGAPSFLGSSGGYGRLLCYLGAFQRRICLQRAAL